LKKINIFRFLILVSLVTCVLFAFEAGEEFQVNTYTKRQQWYPAVAMNERGNFVIVWESYKQDKSDGGIFAQRFEKNGTPLGIEFQVNFLRKGNQGSPVVAIDKKGKFVIAWESWAQDGDNYGIFARRFKKNGKALGKEFQVNTWINNNQLFPAIGIDIKGNFIVTWTSLGQDSDNYGVFAQRFNKNGKPLGTEFQVNTYTENHQWLSQIGFDKNRNFVITWESVGQDQSDGGVFAQRFNKNGKPLGTEFQVNSFSEGNQGSPVIAMDKNGNFIIAWESWEQDGDSYGIFAQRFNKNGIPLGTEFQVNTYTDNHQWLPQIDLDKNGNFVITWESQKQDKSDGGVFAQKFDKNGTPLGTEFQVNSFSKSNQGSPVIAMDKNGNFVIAWESWGQDGDNYGVFAKLF